MKVFKIFKLSKLLKFLKSSNHLNHKNILIFKITINFLLLKLIVQLFKFIKLLQNNKNKML